jgi:hypothetical protein
MKVADMTDAEVIEEWRKGSLAHDTHPECEAGAMDRRVLSMLLELQSFREREPLVQEVLAAIDDAITCDDAACNDRLSGALQALIAFGPCITGGETKVREG